MLVAAGLGASLPQSSPLATPTGPLQQNISPLGATSTNGSWEQSGSATTGSSDVGAVGAGYLATGEALVDYIQWAVVGGRLDGTAHALSVAGIPPGQLIISRSIPLSGTIIGSSIAISFEGAARTFGVITAGQFALNFPQPDGLLSRVLFTAAPAAAFNQALAQLQHQVIATNQTEATAEAVAKTQEEMEPDAKIIADMIATTLPTLERQLTGAVQVVTAADGQTDDALAATKRDEQNTPAGVGHGASPGETCTDAARVAADAARVATHADTSRPRPAASLKAFA